MTDSIDLLTGAAPSSPIAAAALTRTIVQGSVVRWIFCAQIRNGHERDFLFIGEDFLEVKELVNDSHLDFIARKTDFDGRILAASKLTYNETNSHCGYGKSDVHEEPATKSAGSFREAIVLTLDTNCLVFVALARGSDDHHYFTQEITPLPIFDNALLQPGQFLAVDPASRALAVAAYEREVVVCRIKHGLQPRDQANVQRLRNFHISQQRSLQLEGVIQLVDFLSSPDGDDDHIVLLFIVVDQRKVKAVLVDWYDKPDLEFQQVHIHPSMTLAATFSVPTLLLPMRNAAFLLITGSDIHCYQDILSGSIAQSVIEPTNRSADAEAFYPGVSPRYPLWSTWCKSMRQRHKSADCFYLIREDGALTRLQVSRDGQHISLPLGDLGCYVGNACAMLEAPEGLDIFVVAGDTSSGCIAYHSSSQKLLFDDAYTNVPEAADTEIVARIPNWASSTDLVIGSKPAGRTKKLRDSIFVTSGRQPFGTITEMRYGLEARLNFYFDLSDLQSVIDIWAIPLDENLTLLILSSPNATRLLKFSPTAESDVVEELEAFSLTLDDSYRTLAAALVHENLIVQVTEKSICVYQSSSTSNSDCKNLSFENNITVVASCISTIDRLVITARRIEGSSISYDISTYSLNNIPSTDGPDSVEIIEVSRYDLIVEPSNIALIHATSTWVLVCTVEGNIQIFRIDRNSLSLVHNIAMLNIYGEPSNCDGIGIIRSPSSDSEFLAVCALRDGTLFMTVFKDPGFSENITVIGERTIEFGQNSVRLKQPIGDEPIIYAMSGNDFCLLSWDGGSSAHSFRVENVQVTDKERPYLASNAVTACTKLCSPHLSPQLYLAGSVLMVSGSEFLITDLARIPSAIPRQIPVIGSPSRLIYAEQQRCLVCASLRCDVRSFPTTNGKPEERRQIWPVINFVPYRSAEPSFIFEMQPHERVYALLEWSLKVDENKIYSFILVGGSYLKSDGREKGRITFLQPLRKNWGVNDVNEGRRSTFDKAVYALALWDEVTYVACSGHSLHVYRFSPEESKWQKLCDPFAMSSIGINITIKHPRIYISTAQDSTVVLILKERGGQFELGIESLAPRADSLLSHVVPEHWSLHQDSSLTIATTKYGQILGLQNDLQIDTQFEPGQSRLIFEVQLPRSLTRIRQCNVRPAWKSPWPQGVLMGDLIGCATDGSLIGMALLSESFYRRLCWLQRLCEWSEDLCPHLYDDPPYSASDTVGLNLREEQVMPIGLCEGSRDDVVLVTNRPMLRARHIDGDILARIRKPGGIEALERTMQKLAVKDDQVGEWLRTHLENEVGVVHELAQLLEPLLECWI